MLHIHSPKIQAQHAFICRTQCPAPEQRLCREHLQHAHLTGLLVLFTAPSQRASGSVFSIAREKGSAHAQKE